MFGILGGGWKFGGKPAGRPDCWEFACCIPGGGDVPGAVMPGGGAEKTVSSGRGDEGKSQTYPCRAEHLGRHRNQEVSHRVLELVGKLVLICSIY